MLARKVSSALSVDIYSTCHILNNNKTGITMNTKESKKKYTYTSADILVLTDAEHVRKRTQIYLGNTKETSYVVPIFNDDGTIEFKELDFIPAVYKCVGEIVDNCVDELEQTKQKNGIITIDSSACATGRFIIGDNGRGVPIGKHATGRFTPEVVFGELRSGRNFGDDKAIGVIGQNGVGSACVNFCSTEFIIDITRDGKNYKQKFQMGGDIIGKPSVKKTASNKTGTLISFQLDDQVFDNVSLPKEIVNNRAIEIAFNNPGMTVELKDGNKRSKYKYTKGLEDIVKNISKSYHKFEGNNMEFYVITDVYKNSEEAMFTWVNSSLLFEGGLCNTQFTNAFFDSVIGHLSPRAKKIKCEIAKNDVRHNVLILATMKVQDPEYDSQSKTRLTGPNLRTEIQAMIKDQWSGFAKKQKDWLEEVFTAATEKGNAKANRDAAKEMEKLSKQKIPGLLDATSKDRSKCKVFVTEGLSASRQLSEVRDSKTIASYPLTGKVNNVWGAKPSAAANMGKLTGLFAACGLQPGKPVIRSQLRYGGGIVISTDADFDGDDIFTLLCNALYQFWPDMFDPTQPPLVYRLVAPNVVASKGKNRVHFTSMEEFRKQESKYNSGWTIEYMKGLGSMSKHDWDIIINGESDCFIPIQDTNGKMAETLELLFSPDVDKRKEWLTEDI